MDLAEYQKRFAPGESSPGWDAIDEVVSLLYPEQKPRHIAATPHMSIGGNDPIDGISFYEARFEGLSFTHIITYGFSSLYYDEDAVGGDFSKWGFELTFRVAPYAEDPDGPLWAANMIQNIARYVFGQKKWFEPGHFINANGPIRLGADTEITALAFVEDPQLGSMDTVHGRVQFLQMVGLTTEEYRRAESGELISKILAPQLKSNPLLVTDLTRSN